MTYVLTIYDVDKDEFFSETCYDIDGVADLADRIERVICYHEHLKARSFKLISVTLVGGI
ncbi:MAG: hypothetical protein J6R47_04260 [Acholeplasmatales bacterium]|nr:hypothetical protein [Acholeplasmatales bacterium]